MKNGSFTGLDLHKTPPWSALLPEAVLVCGQALTGGDADVHPAMLPQQVSLGPWHMLMLQTMWMFLVHIDARNHVEAWDSCSC